MVLNIHIIMINIFFRFSTRIVNSEVDSLKLFRKFYSWKPKKIYAFYNSEFDKIITQQHLMLMPIDERLATRSHAASSVVPIKNQKIINVSAHMKRLYQHAKSLAIQPCLKEDILLGKVVDTVKAAFHSYLYENTKEDLARESFSLRVIFSSGHGDFGIAARDNGCVFYAIVSESKEDCEENGVHEFTTRQLHLNLQDYSPSKTGNQIEHSIMKSEAKKRGGFSGIKYTKDRIILESSYGNLGLIFQDPQQLVIPRNEKVDVGETLQQAIYYLEESKTGERMKVAERDVTIQEAYLAKEILIFGKDKIIPVLSLDGHSISPHKGPVTLRLQRWHEEHAQEGLFVQI